MKKNSFLVVYIAIFLVACNKCEKRNLTYDQKSWVNHFKKDHFFLYKSYKGQIDTLEIIDTSNYYTSCNKVELSKYQYEIYLVIFRIKSKNNYHNNEFNISVTAEEWQQKIPYIYFGNLGPFRNDLNNKLPIAIDTVLDNIKFKSIYYYAKELNTEHYGEKEYFKNFFWDKQLGLVAYTTLSNELFLRVK